MQVGCLEEIAFEAGWINRDALAERAEYYSKNAYGAYLKGLLTETAKIK